MLALAACTPPAREDLVVYASGADLESANPLATVHPLSRQVQRHALYATLCRPDAALAAQPYWARQWAWSDGARTLTMSLEPALRWHDGRPATARDAAFTIGLARDVRTGYARASDLAAIDRVEARDDTTLVLRFARPQPAVPSILCELPAVPRHLLADADPARLRQHAFERRPVGNGPFRFVARDPGARWIFERNADFPASMGGPPRLRRFVVAVVDEATTKFAGLVSGELDVAGIAPTMASLVARDPGLRVLTYPVLFSTALVFNTQRPPFDDARVRRAMSASIDRRRVIAAALAGYATPAFGPVPPDLPLAEHAADPLDPHRADSLLDAAGWRRGANGMRARGGRAFAVELLTVGAGDDAVEQLVQSDLAARGIRLEIRRREMGAFLTTARAPRKEFDVLLAGIPGDASLAHLRALFSAAGAGGALDYSGFRSPALESAFARATAAVTDAERAAAWREVQRALGDAVPVAWLYHARGVQGVSRRLDGVVMDLRGELATLSSWTLTGARGSERAIARAR